MESAQPLALVQSTIHSAFSGVVLGNGISIRQSEVIDRYGSGCTDEEFRALPRNEIIDDWERVPDEELERACIGHLDPEGFRYYIPALSLSVLRNYDGLSMRVNGTILSLYPKEPLWSHHMRRYDLLNHKQKFALALFLSHLPNLVALEDEEPKQVSRALRNYWCQFLESPSGT